MKRLYVIMLISLISLCSVVTAQAPQTIAEQLLAATVYLEMQDKQGRQSHGSGFFIDEGLVATNFHVIEKAKTASAQLVNKTERFEVLGTVAVDPRRDLAILKVDNLSVHPLVLGNSEAVRIGDPVYTVGNPRGIQGTFSEGRISNILSEGTPTNPDKMIQFTAAISRGSSGGAVVNENVEVIAIVSETRGDGQNLNFAVPVNALQRLLENRGGVTPLSVDTQDTQDRQPHTHVKPKKVDIIFFLVLSVVAFLVLHFLPIVKVEKITVTIGVAIGIGLLMMVAKSVIPTLLSVPLQDLFNAPMSNQGLWHMIDCQDCIPVLVGKITVLLFYFCAMCLIIGCTNRIQGINIEGFFNTCGVALFIVIGQKVIYWILPWI